MGQPGVERVLIEEAAPETSTAAQVVGEIVGSFILAALGLGIGAAAFAAANQGAVEEVWVGRRKALGRGKGSRGLRFDWLQ